MKRTIRWGVVTLALVLAGGVAGAWAQGAAGASPSPSPATGAQPSSGGATFEERLRNAQSVQVLTEILGIEIGAELDEAHEKLARVSDPKDRPKEEKDAEKEEEAEGRREVWKLTGTDFSEVLLQANEKEEITRIVAALRPDKRMPFSRVGDLSKAPLLNDREVAWDVLRPGKPLIRVVARGAERQASTLTLLLVRQRPAEPATASH